MGSGKTGARLRQRVQGVGATRPATGRRPCASTAIGRLHDQFSSPTVAGMLMRSRQPTDVLDRQEQQVGARLVGLRQQALRTSAVKATPRDRAPDASRRRRESPPLRACRPRSPPPTRARSARCRACSSSPPTRRDIAGWRQNGLAGLRPVALPAKDLVAGQAESPERLAHEVRDEAQVFGGHCPIRSPERAAGCARPARADRLRRQARSCRASLPAVASTCGRTRRGDRRDSRRTAGSSVARAVAASGDRRAPSRPSRRRAGPSPARSR